MQMMIRLLPYLFQMAAGVISNGSAAIFDGSRHSLFDIENKRQVKPLPLFASFTTEDIHSNRKLEEKRFKQYFHKPSFGYYGSQACEKTIGTVLIDEVDLHLHPTLQVSVLKGFLPIAI